MNGWTPEDFANAISGFRRELAGLARRMVIGVVPNSIWQLVGHYADYANQGMRETRDVEMFPGIGHFARPPKNSTSAEAIMVQVGGPNGAVGIATRDEATRAAKVDDIANDESVLYNTQARVWVASDGTVKVCAHGGTPVSLALKSDVADFVTKYNSHTHAGVAVGSATSAVPAPLAIAPTGTSKLLGE